MWVSVVYRSDCAPAWFTVVKFSSMCGNVRWIVVEYCLLLSDRGLLSCVVEGGGCD